MKKNFGYTKKEINYNQKSLAATFGGSFLHGFGATGFSKSPKASLFLKSLGIASSFGLSSYYDVKSFEASKAKGRNVFNAISRGVFGGFGGAYAGRQSALGLVSLLKLTKKQTSKVAANETVKFYRAKPANNAAKLSNMMKDKAVKFIRIRGRIVPIRGKSTRVGPALLAAPKG